MADGSGTLFRRQVLERRRQRLYGSVTLRDERVSSVFVVAIGIFSALLILWAATATYPRTVQIVGAVTTSRPAAKVFAARQGSVHRLFVKEGDHVRPGWPIAFVSVQLQDRAQRSSGSDAVAALRQQDEAVRSQLRDDAVADGQDRRRLLGALASNRAEMLALRQQIVIQDALIVSSSDTIKRLMPVLEKGFISLLEMNKREQALLVQRQQREQMGQQLAQLDGRRRAIGAELDLLPIGLHKRSANFEEKLQTIAEQRSRAEMEVGYTITAPLEGDVTSLQTAPGRTVDPRLPLMVILPGHARFEAELFAPTRAIGFIRVGQRVKVMYDAFPYKQFGSFGGVVAAVSHTALSPAELDVPVKLGEAVYRVRVRLDRQQVPAFGQSFPLQLGMSLTATVLLERRSLLDWLLEPVNAVRRRS